MFSLPKSNSLTRRPLAAVGLLLILFSTQVGTAYALPQDAVVDATREIVEGREFVTGYVTDIKSKYKPESTEYNDAKKLYRIAVSKYNGWATAVKGAIRSGKAKKIQNDSTYKKAAAEASAAAKSFTDYVESKQGKPKGFFAVLGSLADVGIKVWNAYKDRQDKERSAQAEAFYEDVKWDQWELIGVNDSAAAKGQDTDDDLAKGGQKPFEEVQLGDPPTEDAKGAEGEPLTLGVSELKTIEQLVSAGGAKGQPVNSKELAMLTLKLAGEYADQHISRKEPPRPTKVKTFLSLYGLPFVLNGKLVPYCAAGVGYAAARAHYLLAHQNTDARDDQRLLRSELSDLTRDYALTHPGTRVMVSEAKRRGTFVSHKVKPEQGWLVFYNWSGSKAFPQHVGIVNSVESDGRILRTVEFNTSNDNPSNGGRVERKTRSVRYVMGYIRTYPSDQPAEATNR